MWSILALGAIERCIHHFIDLDAITRIQLNRLQGKLLRVVIDSPQLSVDVFFDEHKVRLEPTVTGHAEKASIFEQRPFDQQHCVIDATATLHVPNVISLLKLLLSDPEQIGNVPLQGDYHLLQDIQRILNEAEPDLASHLSPWVGLRLHMNWANSVVCPNTSNVQSKADYFLLKMHSKKIPVCSLHAGK